MEVPGPACGNLTSSNAVKSWRGKMGPSRPNSPLSIGIPRRARDLQKQCYTSPFPHMLKTATCRCLCILVLLALPLAAVVPQGSPSPLASAAGDLVQQILSRSGSPSAVAVSFQNISTMSGEAQELVQNAVFNAF